MKKILLGLIFISGLISAQTTPDIEMVRTATVDSVTTTPGYVLTTSASGLPIWAVPQTAGTQIYWFYKTVADVGGYYYMKNIASTGGIQSNSFVGITNGQLLVTHITEVGFPGLTFIPAGTVTIHTNAEKPNGTKNLSLYTEIYKRSYPAGVETLICTTGNSIPLVTGAAASELIFTGTIPIGIDLLISDRIVKKTYSHVSGGGSAPDVIIYSEDATQSRIELPASSINVNNFWGTQGNPIADSTVNFLGTTNALPLIFKTNSIERLKINDNGNILITKRTVTTGDTALMLENGIIKYRKGYITGSTGSTGSTGTTGSTGSSGATGSTGSTSSTGKTGATGSTGSTSNTGSTGSTGSTGADGALTAWSLLGNAGTVAATNFIGTTDAIDFRIRTNNTEKVSITSGGNVGIGTTTPTVAKLQVETTVANQGVRSAIATTTGTNYAIVGVANGAGATDNYGVYINATSATNNYSLYTAGPSASANNYQLYLAGTAKSYINGVVGIGETTPVVRLSQNLAVSTSAAYGGMAINNWNATGICGLLDFNTSNSITSGVYTLKTNGQLLGAITFRGSDGAAFTNGASIQAIINGTPASGVMPTDLQFFTSSSTTQNVERMRISNTGNVGIGTTSPASKLDIEGGVSIGSTYSGTTAAPTNGAIIEGKVAIGKTSTSQKFHVQGSSRFSDSIYYPKVLVFTTDSLVTRSAGVLGYVAPGTYAKLASPTFTGTPAAPTPSINDSTTKIATTAFVDRALTTGYVDVTSYQTVGGVKHFTSHIKSTNSVAIPTIAVTTQNGVTAAAISSNSSDMAGSITTTGTNNGAGYTQLTITFNESSYVVYPKVVVSPTEVPGTGFLYYVVPLTSAGTGSFDLFFKASAATASMTFNWIMIE